MGKNIPLDILIDYDIIKSNQELEKGIFMKKNALLSLMICMSLFAATGCKSAKQIVKDISVTTSNDQEDNVYATVDSYLDVGTNANVPSIELPIKKPGASISYGTFRMASTLDGLIQVTVTANLSSLLKLPAGPVDLPNGSKLPIGGVELLDVIEIPLDGINAEVYVTSSNGVVMLGFAIAIKQFDQAGNWVGGNANIFPAFTIKGIRGMAGAFTGEQPGQTGLAVFASFSSTISGYQADLLASGAKASELLSASDAQVDVSSVENAMFRSSLPSKGKQLKMLKAFRRFKKSGVTVLTPVTR